MTDALVVDADAHVNEDPFSWTSLNERYPGWLTLGTSGGKPVALIDGKPYPRQEGPGRGVPIDSALAPAALQGAIDLDRRISDMDAEGIDIQVLFGGLSIGVTGFSDVGFARDFASTYNDWLLDEICGRYPERLKGVCSVALQDVDASVEELERVAAKGAAGVTIPPVVGDRNLDDPQLLPFFAAAEDADIALAVHSAPGMNLPLPAADRFSNYVQVHTLSFPIDPMVAFTALAYGGVLDRFPRLRIVHLEAGVGWVPYFIDRVQEHREKRADMVPDMKSDPHEYIARGQTWFSFECEDPFVDLYVERFGADSLVFASDYPHWDCDFPGTVEEARQHNAKLGDEAVRKLMGANALRLYGLG